MGRQIQATLQDTARVYEQLHLRGGLTAMEMAAALNLDRKRIYDHLAYLRAFLGDDVITNRRGRFSLALDAPRPLRLPQPDRRMLAIANQLLDAVGMPYGHEFEKLFVRLLGGNTEEAQAERARLGAEARQHLHFAEPVLYKQPREAALITRLYELCTARPRLPVRFTYDSITTPGVKARRIWPLGLVFNHAWYLVGYDEKKEPPVRTYALDRLSQLHPEKLGKPLALDDFDLSARMLHAWRLIVSEGEPQRVVLRMTPGLAAARKHSSQREDGPDGEAVRVSFLVSEPAEMLGFVLAHLDAVEVLEPASLKHLVEAKLTAALARLGTPHA